MPLTRKGIRIHGRRRVVLFTVFAVVLLLLVCRFDYMRLSYRMAAAQGAIQRHDWTAAIALLQRCETQGRELAKWHYLMACVLRRSGQVDKVKEHLAASRSLGWNPADIDRQEVLVEAQTGGVKKVETQLVSTIQQGASDEAAEEIYEAMARGYLAGFYIADAKQCLNFWMEWQPNNPLPRIWLADLHRRTENLNGAISQYRQVLEQHPRSKDARLKLAECLLESLEIEEATVQFQEALSQSPTDVATVLGLAECLRRQGRTREAKNLLYDALVGDTTSPQAAKALAALGQIAIEEQQYARAVFCLQKSVALEPNEPASRTALAVALAGVGNAQAAAQQREEVRKIVEQHNRLLAFTRQVVNEPENAELRYKVGLIFVERGMLSAGADWLKTAVQIDPSHRAAHLALADIYDRIGAADEAQRQRRIAEQAALDLDRET